MSTRRFVFAVCGAAWALSVVACCFPSDKNTAGEPATVIEQVGDGPPAAVPARNADHQPRLPDPPSPAPAAGSVKAGNPPAVKSAARTPEARVAEWEALAAQQYPDVAVRAAAPKEVLDTVRAVVAYRRAEWVAERTRLAEPRKYSQLDADHLNVGESGYLPGGFTTVRVDSDTVVFRTRAGTLFAFSGLNTSTMVSDRGYKTDEVVECYRTGKFGLYTLPVVRHKNTAVRHNPEDVKVSELAAQRAMAADQVADEATTKLARLIRVETDKAEAAASAEAARQIPVPKTGPALDQVKAKLAHEKLEKELREKARQEVEARYAVPAVPR